MSRINAYKEYYKSHEKAILEDFFQFLRFPSVSADSQCRPQLLACKEWLAAFLKKLGFSVEEWPTSRHPVLFATHLQAGPEKPTVLIYHHYDVQPADPLEQWETPPFEPTIRNGQVYARGAQDNKGQCLYTLQAIKAILDREGKLPVNLKLCIEGEEEIGSHGLYQLVPQKKAQLAADHVLIVDLGLYHPDIPVVSLGVRGILSMEILFKGSHVDLHSGAFGGIAYNPNHALVEVLAKMRGEDGSIRIPGFYDHLRLPTEKERQEIQFNADISHNLATLGIQPTGGEKQYQPLESNWIRPTLEINGIYGGYSGEGIKTVIPAEAHAKITCRLVPDQDPAHLVQVVRTFIEKNVPPGITATVTLLGEGSRGIRISPHSPGVQRVAQAFSEVMGKPCEYILQGGSIPIVACFHEHTGGDVILMGYGLDEDLIHAPNEHFGLDRLEKGFLTMVRALELLSETQ